ncbi:MAG: DMT family transporter [Selenomonadaceae bacterium]|nr:DMT family transporter [Selenomonadaceae bacterium]
MQLRGTLMLLGASFFWGTTFVAQMSGMEGLGPFSYAAARYLLGVISVVIVWLYQSKERNRLRRAGKYRSGFLVGLGSGAIMFIASSLQQVSMLYTTAGKAAFITCLYIVFVPLGAALLGKVIRRENWIGAFTALIGLYMLAVTEEFSLQFGDLILFISSFFWTAQILFIDRYAPKVDVIELSVAQLFVCFVFSTGAMLMLETPTPGAFADAWFPIAYGGIMSAGVAFTLQIYGQKYAEPSTAAILMSFEAVFGALSSWAILGEVMSSREIFGCALMLVGMIITQFKLSGGRRR